MHSLQENDQDRFLVLQTSYSWIPQPREGWLYAIRPRGENPTRAEIAEEIMVKDEKMDIKIPKATHIATWGHTDTSGLKRHIECVRWDDGSIQFTIKSFFDGTDKEPSRFSMRLLSVEAFNAFTECLMEFGMHMDKHKIVDKEAK